MTYQSIESLEFFKDLERLCDEVWFEVCKWAWFEKKAMGAQLTRALDSVDANLCEGEGRWHDRERLHHLYIARGSMQEAVRWLKKSVTRKLIDDGVGKRMLDRADHIHRRMNKLITYRRDLLRRSS